MRTTEALLDARRAMEICNACRYCEDFCAVFPAMARRRDFAAGDLSHLANLCHNCRGCFHACQYAPPHPFGLNLPRTFAELRADSYQDYAWPRPLAALWRHNGVVVALVTALSLAAVLVLAALLVQPDSLFGRHEGPGAFYAVVPHSVMAGVAGATGLFALLALVMGLRRYWRDAGPPGAPPISARAWRQALSDALTLRHLGGRHGCNDIDDRFSSSRRWCHHALFYGFVSCFAATATATLFAFAFGWAAPYRWFSLPVLLGTVGGLGLVVGTTGMLWLKLAGDQEPTARRLLGGDVAFILLLLLSALTGLGLLALRATGAMGLALALHLGCVLALFLLLPYSKFIHGLYRAAALLRHAHEGDAAPPDSAPAS